MNIKILAQNIVNNINDFTPEQIEKYFQDYAESHIQYWKKRCELAEKFIQESPCDNDITDAQLMAWTQYNTFVNSSEN